MNKVTLKTLALLVFPRMIFNRPREVKTRALFKSEAPEPIESPEKALILLRNAALSQGVLAFGSLRVPPQYSLFIEDFSAMHRFNCTSILVQLWHQMVSHRMGDDKTGFHTTRAQSILL